MFDLIDPCRFVSGTRKVSCPSRLTSVLQTVARDWFDLFAWQVKKRLVEEPQAVLRLPPIKRVLVTLRVICP